MTSESSQSGVEENGAGAIRTRDTVARATDFKSERTTARQNTVSRATRSDDEECADGSRTTRTAEPFESARAADSCQSRQTRSPSWYDGALVAAAYAAVRIKQGKRPHGFILPGLLASLAATTVAILGLALCAGLLAERALGSRPPAACVPADVACSCWVVEPLVLEVAETRNLELVGESVGQGVWFLGDAGRHTGALRLSSGGAR